MSNLSELLPAGAGAKSASFVASGTLASGVTVALKSNGQVEAISGAANNVGSATAFTSSTWVGGTTVYDSVNDKIVVFYYDAAAGGYGTAVVGTISGSSISFGTPVVFLSAAVAQEVGATFATTSGKCVVGFQDSSASYIGNAFVGTVSGTSISFGSKTTFNSGVTSLINLMYDSTSNVVLFSYTDTGNSNYGTSRAATVSGTSLSYGSEVVFKSTSNAQYISQAHDVTANRNVIVYQDNANSSYGTAVVATMSGTSISFGTPVVFESATVTATGCVYDPTAGKVAVFTSTGKGWVGTPSGSTISFGTPVNFETSAVYNPSPVYNSSAQKVLLNYVHSSQTFSRSVDISGTSISYSDAFLAYASGNTALSAAYDSAADRTALVVRDVSNSNRGVGLSYQYGTSLFADFVGITDEAISSAASGSVVVQGGVITNTGLIPLAPVVGTAVTFDTGPVYHSSVAFDSNSNKVVIAYDDNGNSDYGTAIVGTVSGTAISFGSAVVFESATTRYTTSVFDSNSNKIVIAYADIGNSQYGTAIVGTVSGTSISFGTPVIYESAVSRYQASTFDSSSNKVVIAYQDNGNSDYGTAVVGTVSGTSISFGSPVVYEAAQVQSQSAGFDSTNNKVVITYKDQGNSNYGTAIVGTVSGTSISFGSAVVFEAATTSPSSVTYDSTAQKIIISYVDSAASTGNAIVGTVSGTSISFGSPVVFSASAIYSSSVSYDTSQNKIVISYGNASSGKSLSGTVSGTTISFGTTTTFAAAATGEVRTVYDSSTNRTVTTFAPTTGYAGKAIVGNLSNALTIASDYYVQADGTISTTVTTVPAGRALSTTSMLLEG